MSFYHYFVTLYIDRKIISWYNAENAPVREGRGVKVDCIDNLARLATYSRGDKNRYDLELLIALYTLEKDTTKKQIASELGLPPLKISRLICNQGIMDKDDRIQEAFRAYASSLDYIDLHKRLDDLERFCSDLTETRAKAEVEEMFLEFRERSCIMPGNVQFMYNLQESWLYMTTNREMWIILYHPVHTTQEAVKLIRTFLQAHYTKAEVAHYPFKVSLLFQDEDVFHRVFKDLVRNGRNPLNSLGRMLDYIMLTMLLVDTESEQIIDDYLIRLPVKPPENYKPQPTDQGNWVSIFSKEKTKIKRPKRKNPAKKQKKPVESTNQ